MNGRNEALNAEKEFLTSVEEATEYIENFDILETINNVGNDEVFTPVKLCNRILDILPDTVWSNPELKWLNPCDKNGVFLREIAIRLNKGLKHIITDEEKRKKHILKNMIFSLGLTKFTSLVSRRTVYYCSYANRKFSKEEEGYAIGNGEWFDNEEGNIKTPKTEHSFGKDNKCIYCRTSKLGKYTDENQIEHYAYEFIHTDDVKTHLQNRFFGGNSNMKFDIIIGNPPYQLSDGGFGASATAIYPNFVLQAIKLNPKFISMIIPTRWISDGKGVKDFRESIISDKRLKVLHDFSDAHYCFPTVTDIKGGVCYFLWDRDFNDKCSIYNYDANGDLIEKSIRYLKDTSIESDIVLRDSRWVSILQKVQQCKEDSFSKIVSPRKPYGLSGDVFDKTDKYKLPPMSNEPLKNGYTIIGRSMNKPAKRYINSKYPIIKNKDTIRKWKIFTQRNVGAGKIGDYMPAIIVGKPKTLCTETYLMIGPFESNSIARNVASYMKTKLFRLLVEMRKNTQGVNKDKFNFVPMQDFSKTWCDQELFIKYKLTEKEILYIETNIKEME